MTSNTGATGEIAFMDKMLADFRSFCNNDENRLKNFWDECVAQNNSAVDPAIEAVDSSLSETLSNSTIS